MQHLATISAIAEAFVNILVSVLLVTRMGAAGVAIGTLIGAFVSVGMRLLVSIPRTRRPFICNDHIVVLGSCVHS